MRQLFAGLVLLLCAGTAQAQTTISGPITFGSAFSVDGAGTVSLATSQPGLTCAGCTLSGTTTLPNGVVTNAGLVGIGTASPSAPLVVDSSINPLGAGFGSVVIQGTANKERVDIYSAGATPGPAFQGKGFHGTVAAPTATLSGDTIFILGGSGYDGAAFAVPNPAVISMHAAENWSSTAHGTYTTIETTANGSTSRLERMRVTDAGFIGIGTTTPNYLMQLHDGAGTGALLQFTNATTGSGAGNGAYVGFLAGGTDLWIDNQTSGAVKILAGGVEQLRVDSGGGFYLDHLPTTPGGKQPLCVDTSSKQVYDGSAGAC